MTIAQELAQRSHDVRFEELPPEAVHWAKVVILDTVGVALAGAVEECTRIVQRVATADGSHGPSVLFGTDRQVAPLEAALVNGTAAHALDFDCGSSTLGGHPTVHLVPALYALSELIEADGKAFIAAFVAGMATQVCIARGAQPQLFLDGWFTSSTIGIFGTTAGACHLLRLPPEQTAQALGVASMFASGIIANAGTMTKPLGAGHCARSGLLAALLARSGFTAASDAIENRRGFLELFNGSGRYDVNAILSGWTDPLDVLTRGLSIKQYPCCGIVQAHIDVLRELIAQHGLVAERVQRVDALIHPQRIRHVDRPDPRSNIEAKFSAHYCLALTILQGCPTLQDFEGARFEDPAIRELMARIHVAPDPAGEASASNLGEQFGASVSVTTTDGRSVCAKIDRPLGGGPETPLPRSLLEAKFMNCAGRVLEPGTVSNLLDVLWHIDEMKSLRSVSAAMVPVSSCANTPV